MKNLKFHFLLFTIFSLLTVVFTYPWVFRFDSSLYGSTHSFILVWRLWWERVSGGQLFTPLVGAPQGSQISTLTDAPFLFSFTRFLTWILGREVLAYNLVLFLSFPLAGLFTFWLVDYLVSTRKVAFLAGLIFAFSPYHIAHLFQLTVGSIQFLPLFVLSFLKLKEKPSLRASIFCAFAIAAVILSDFYYGYFIFLFSTVFLAIESSLFFLLERRLRFFYPRQLLFLFLAAVLSFAMISPFLLPLFRQSLVGGGRNLDLPLKNDLNEIIIHSARPWDYFFPHNTHPFFGQYSERMRETLTQIKENYWFYLPRSGEGSNFLGWTLTISSASSFLYWVRKKLWKISPWVGCFSLSAALLFIFSLPPDIFLGKTFHQTLPTFYLWKLFPMFRAYTRLAVLVLLCLIIVFSFGLSEILKGKSPKRKVFVLLAFLLLLGVEYANAPYKYLSVFDKVPPVYQWLKNQPGDFIIAENYQFYHFGSCESCLLWQRYHQKRLYGPRELIFFDTYKPLADPSSYELRKMPDKKSEKDLNLKVAEKMVNDGVKYYIIRLKDSFRSPFREAPLLKLELPEELPPQLKLVKTFPDALIYKIAEQK